MTSPAPQRGFFLPGTSSAARRTAHRIEHAGPPRPNQLPRAGGRGRGLRPPNAGTSASPATTYRDDDILVRAPGFVLPSMGGSGVGGGKPPPKRPTYVALNRARTTFFDEP